MIIVKTTNGEQFVNDAQFDIIAHDNEEKNVILMRGNILKPVCTIHKVKGITYVGPSQTGMKNEE